MVIVTQPSTRQVPCCVIFLDINLTLQYFSEELPESYRPRTASVSLSEVNCYSVQAAVKFYCWLSEFEFPSGKRLLCVFLGLLLWKVGTVLVDLVRSLVKTVFPLGSDQWASLSLWTRVILNKGCETSTKSPKNGKGIIWWLQRDEHVTSQLF